VTKQTVKYLSQGAQSTLALVLQIQQLFYPLDFGCQNSRFRNHLERQVYRSKYNIDEHRVEYKNVMRYRRIK